MNIQTVADNLRKTIAGKEEYLEAIQKERTFVGLRDGEDIALSTVAKFLAINIDELKKILKDVEQCIPKNIYNDMDPGRDYLDGPMIKMFRED